MESRRHAFAEHDEVRPDAQRAKIKYLWPPESGLNFVNAHQRAGAIAAFPRQLQVIGLNCNRFAIHEDRLSPKAGDAFTVFPEGSGELPGVVWLHSDGFATLDHSRPQTAEELR